MPWITSVFLTITLSMLAACGADPGEAAFELYLERLGRTLEVEPAAPPTALPIPRLPRTAQLRLPIARQSVSILEFLDLGGCELQVNVGKRNSSLGRLALDSQRLLLELEFLRLSPGCLAQLRSQGEEELAGRLESVVDIKRRQLPLLLFNATLANVEFHGFWKPVDAGWAYPGESVGSEVIAALEELGLLGRQWLGGNYALESGELEQLLATVARGDGGRLWHALAVQGAWLERANGMIDSRMARGPLCAENLRHDAADIVPNVVRRYFITGIQPRAADLGRRYYQLMPPLQGLEELLEDVLPDNYRDWRGERDRAFQRLGAKPREHVEKMQSLLKNCRAWGSLATNGLTPSAGPVLPVNAAGAR